MKTKLTGLTAEHSFEKGFAESLAAPGGRERLADMLEQNPPVAHPVLRTHPESGRTSVHKQSRPIACMNCRSSFDRLLAMTGRCS